MKPDAYFATPQVACLVRSLDSPGAVALGPRERAIYDLMEFEGRRVEWLAGRAVSKELLRLRHGLQPEEVEILPGPDQAPRVYVDSGERPDIRLTISHTHSYAAAACARVPVGVDLCDMVDAVRVERVQKRVFNEGEAELIGAYLSDERRAAVWSVKEAALKATGGGVFSPGPRAIKLSSLVPLRFATLDLEASLFRLPLAVLALVVTK